MSLSVQFGLQYVEIAFGVLLLLNGEADIMKKYQETLPCLKAIYVGDVAKRKSDQCPSR
jgi:hypothetical protein